MHKGSELRAPEEESGRWMLVLSATNTSKHIQLLCRAFSNLLILLLLCNLLYRLIVGDHHALIYT
jgi:hypothetical protein